MRAFHLVTNRFPCTDFYLMGDHKICVFRKYLLVKKHSVIKKCVAKAALELRNMRLYHSQFVLCGSCKHHHVDPFFFVCFLV